MQVRLLAPLVIALALAGSTPHAQTTPSAADLAARIQAHYATVRDFTADFTLTQTSALVPRGIVERGEVKVKKPGRMRWAYNTDDKKLFVADGMMLYSYFPRDKYVMVTRLPQGADASTALLFLSGRGDLTRDFTATRPDDQPASAWRVVLTPKTRQADFRSLTIDVDRRTFQIRGLQIVDDQGGTSKFEFARMRENVGLPDREFEFTPPRGVEIRSYSFHARDVRAERV